MSWSRDDVKVTVDGTPLKPAAGLGSWEAFSGSARAAIVDGDFVMQENEVQPTLQALRARDIHVVALHNHMIGEKPRLYFLHYRGRGEARELAEALRYAMDVQAAARHER